MLCASPSTVMAFVAMRCWVATLVFLLMMGAISRTASARRQLQQTQVDQDLWQAANDGDIFSIKIALNAGANIEIRDAESNMTPLLTAVSGEHLDVVEELVANGADVEATANGFTALMSASDSGNLEIVLELLLAGAEVDRMTRKFSYTPLFYASLSGHVTVVKLLIAQDANVNSINNGGSFPLMAASETGHIDVVRQLLRFGADPNLQKDDKGTALHLASFTLGKVSEEVAIALLDAGAKLNIVDNVGWTPLMQAAFLGNVFITKLLVNRGAKTSHNGTTAFDLICMCLEAGGVELPECPLGGCVDPDTKLELVDILSSAESVESSEPDKSVRSGDQDDFSDASPPMDKGCNSIDCFELADPNDRLECALECQTAIG